MAQCVSTALDGICQSEGLGALTREQRLAKSTPAAITQAESDVRAAERKVYDTKQAAVIALWSGLGFDGQQTYGAQSLAAGKEVTERLQTELGKAFESYKQGLSAGLAALESIWDNLAACEPAAATAVQSGDEWTAFTAAETSRSEAIAAVEMAKQAKSITHLLDSVSVGGLSRPSVAGHEHAPAIVAKFANHPEVAEMGLELLPEAPHPEVLAGGVEALGPLMASKFAYQVGSTTVTQGNPEIKGRNALAMGSQVGGDYFEKLTAYYAADKHARHDPLNPNPAEGSNPLLAQKKAMGRGERAAVYTAAISKKALQAAGKVDFSKASEEMDDLRFHPDSLLNPLFGLVNQIGKCQTEFADHSLHTVLNQVTTITPGSEGLVLQTFGEESGSISLQDAQAAVLAAMMTPFHQGPVGSCFATAPCRKLRETNPKAVMEDLVAIVNTGNLTRGRDPVPAVTSVPKNENPLLRSWEYTVATASARQDNSQEKQKLGNALFGAYDVETRPQTLEGLQPLFTADWKQKRTQIEQKIAAAFTFNYDPEAERIDASDGSSTKGAYQLIDKATRDPVTTESQFKERVKGILREVLVDSITGEPLPQAAKQRAARLAEVEARKLEVGDKIADIVDSAAFRSCLEAAYTKSGQSYAPWNLPSGGRSEGPTDLLFGSHAESTSLVERESASTPIAPTELLAGIVGKLGGGRDDFVSMGATGIHEMNALPKHPSLAPLRDGDVAANIETHLAAPGRAIAEAPIPAGRAQFIFQQALKKGLGGYLPTDTSSLTPPGEDMRPQVLKELLLEGMKSKIDEKVAADYSNHEESKDIEARAKAKGDYDKAVARHEADVAAIQDKHLRDIAKIERDHAAAVAAWQALPAEPPKGPEPVKPTLPTMPASPPRPTEPDYDAIARQAKEKLRSDLRSQHQGIAAGLVDTLLIKELDVPQFVIADTNWGDASDQKQLVVAPDPSTGAPVVWKKGALAGDFQRLDDEGGPAWMKSDWTAFA
jgi:hypothetical protein